MEFLYFIVILFLGIVISDVLNKMFPRINIIFFQIIMGILISYIPIFKDIEIMPELFMIMIIKPIIFSESQKLPLEELKNHGKEIFSLSVPLVICTIIIAEFGAKILAPSIPVFITSILVAMVIPTNSSIVRSISAKLKFPEEILAVLEGESLFNESIAVLMFELLLHAGMSNTFHLKETINEFIFAIGRGAASGLILGYIIIKIRYYLIKNNFENESMLVVLQIVTPFVVYFIAEKCLHFSGILAVIISGLLYGVERQTVSLKLTRLQVVSDSTWRVITYILEGVAAVYLGVCMPGIIRDLVRYNKGELYRLIIISIIIYSVVALLRFIWVKLEHDKFIHKNEDNMSQSKIASIYALSGIHGTVTLVIALSLPEVLEDGTIFMFRHQLIFISMMVILISIILPTIIFPKLLREK